MISKDAVVGAYDFPVAPPAPLDEGITIDGLEVKFDASSTERQRTLYANGRMQVRVLVLVSGRDGNANKVALPDSVLSTVRLIHYNGGQPLSDGWSSTTEENEFAHELPGRFARMAIPSSEIEEGALRVLSFWVSTSKAVSTQIAAEVTIDGQVFRSNKVGGSYIDSSVTLKGIAPATYASNSFSVEPHWVQGAPIFVHHIGLFPVSDGGRNIPLVRVEWGGNDVEGMLSAYKAGVYEDKVRLDVLNAKHMVMGVSGGQLWGRCHDVMNYIELRDGQVIVLGCVYDLYYLALSRGRKLKLSLVDVYGTAHALLMSVEVATLTGQVAMSVSSRKEMESDHRLERHKVTFNFERG